MIRKLRIATFKLLDILVILTMLSASPMNVSATALAQEASPVLAVNPSDYAPGESAHVTGSGFTPGDYILAINGPEMQWGPVTPDGDGNFESDSPALDSAGSYEVRAYASPWNGNWDDPDVASTTFTVTAPPPATEPPTEEPTATSTDTPTEEPTTAPTDPPTEEPTATSTNEPTSEPTATETPTATTEPTQEPTPAVPPTIASDLADYPQGGLVTLTGANWQGDTQVRIIVNDDIGQTWRRDVTVAVADDGTITDSFNLPSFFVATFNVTARGLETGRVATTSFTDAPKITAKTHQGQEKPVGTYTSGNITTYQEGDFINFRFTLEANEASSGQLQVRFTGDDGTCLFFDGSFNLGTHDGSAPAIQPISGATPTVTTAGAPVATGFGTSGGEWVQTLNITFSAAGESVVNYYLKLSDEAGECNGSSQHSRLNPAGGDVGQSGQQNVPVPANQIIELPEITVIKNIDRDGNGSFEDTADAGEYCFTLDSGSCIPTNASGQVVFTNVAPDGAHTITETQLDFSQGTYDFISGSGTNCTFSGGTATATVASGTTSTDATCVFNNGLTNGTLTIVKVVVNDNGGTKQVSDFPLFYNGTPATSGVANTVTPGNYTVTETQQAGYTATFSGDCNSSGVVTVGAGQNKTCTITNNDQPGTLIVIKHVINDNGGTATATNFTLDSGGANDSPDDFAGTEAPGTSVTLDAGSYNVTETGPSGYTASFSAGCSGSITNGETKTCTVTNDDNAATLIVIKHVINDNGGTATAGNFTMNVTATNPSDDSFPGAEAPGTNITLDAGSYSVSETGPSGYNASYSTDCSGTIAAGQTKTCTVTNNDQPGTLIVKKVVVNDNGGTATADDFSFEVNGGTAIPFEADGQNDLPVDAGTYDVTEPAVTGYSSSYDNCTDVVVPNGGSATCTITNDDVSAHLTLVKEVVNDNGGTVTANQWTLSAAGPTPLSGAGGADGDVNAGTYTLSETGPSGYTASEWSCVGGSQNGTQITLANGQSATCTITNDDQAAHLKLVKVVTNDNGGKAVATDFTLSASGPTPISGAGGAESDVDAGTYTLSETSVPGYSASAWSCVGGMQNGSDITLANGQSATCTINNHDNAPSLTLVKAVVNDNGGTAETTDFILSANGPTPISGAGGASSDASFDAGTYDLSETSLPGYSASAWVCTGGDQTDGDTVVIGLDEDVTCTITNDDDAPSLTLVKEVINDNGGTAVAADFTLSANGPTPISGAGGATSEATFDAGTYNLSETNVPGYTASDWVCTGGTQNDGDTVMVGLGQDVTCTITNDDSAPSLTLVKVVVNDNGGTATANQWTLTASGPTGFSGTGPSVSSDADFDAGTYILSESGPAGYTASAWSCVGGTQNGSDVTLANGESATCTITNNDNAPSLTLVKVVINDNGGTALTTDFTLSANGPTPISGAGGATSDATFDAGTYDLSETGPAGYTASDWVCMGGTQNDVDTITLGLGESATCTITNDDQAPSLTLIKMVINNDGGNALASDWTLTVSGPTGFSGPGPSVSNGTSFDTGTYDLSESGPTGYLASDWVCAGGTQDDANTITLELGESATCTITNNDVAPTLKLVKVVSNNNGGNAVANDWTLLAEAASPNDGRNFSNPGGSGIFQTVFANTGYDLSESTVAGYTAGNWSCDGGTLVDSTITLAEGETGVTCTITNDDSAPTLTLIKIVVNDDGGDAAVSDFPLFINGNSVTSGTSNTLSANTLYTASETNLAGYTASAWGGDCNPDGTITLNEGEAAVCTITNDDVAPTLTLIKNVINDDGGNAAPDDFNLTIGGNPATSGTAYTLEANTAYEINETLLAGYSFVEITGDPECPAVLGGAVTLDEGENVTCTITNDDVAPTLTLIKIVVNDDGGNAVIGDFPLFINSNPVTSGTANTLSANTLYTASETTLAGYTPSTWGGDCAADGTITLNEGENATCTITNDDVAPTLKLVKEVTNDNGGNAVADDWTLSAEAASPFEGRNFSNLGGSGAFETVFANQGYDLSETTVAGYTAGTWECDGGTLVDSTVTLDEGETGVTCTITNDDVAPQLRLIKIVVNNDGGNANIADFPLFIDGNAVTSGVFVPVTANTVHTATETNLTGYTASTWGGDCAADGTITLNEGETKTCTITNDDVAPTLKLVKEVTNDDGGNAVADDWTLSAEAASPFEGRNFSNAGGSGAFETVFANQGYNLSESTVPGYTAGAWDCDGGTLVGSTVTLSEGETGVTCTITNDDVAPTLTLIKNVINNNGGNAQPDDFNLTIGGSAATSGTTYTLDANMAYAINETLLSGYTFVEITGSAECPAVLGGTVILDEGENVTCTITNDDIAPTLTLIKNVINDSGGNAQPDDFKLTIGGNAATSGTAYTLDANTPYAIDETQVTGYSFVDITGDPECPVALGGTVTLDEGENVTCTITNDDQPATLIIIKHVVNDNGGTADAGDFTLDSGGTDDTPDDFPGEEDPGTTVTLDAGAYNVTETGPSGYSASFSADCAGSIANGETKTCTVTNDDIQPQLIVIKHVINDNGGTADAGDFTMEVSGNNVNPVNFAGNELGVNVALDAGSYSVGETGPAGYAPSFSANCTGAIAVGETKTCTVTNNDIAPTLTVVKILLPNNDTGKFNLQIDGETKATNVVHNGSTGAVAVNVGIHTVSETAGTGTSLANYVTTIGGDCAADGTITLALAENKTCTITNARRGTIIVEKQTNPNAAPGSFTFSGHAAGTIADNGTIVVPNLAPGTYTSTEADPSPILFALTSIVCNDGSSANPSTGNVATRTATFNLDPGETVKCTFTNTKDFHAGTIGFWKNWRNHYTSSQFQSLINYLKTNNPKVYNKDLVNNTPDDLTIAKHDAIMNVGKKTPREQMILAQFTALKLNLAITQLDGTDGLVQKNDDICLAGTVDVSGISGATAFFGTSTPAIEQVVNKVESKWTGKLTTNRSDWKWNLTTAQKDMLIKVISGINEGTLVVSSGCP